MSRQNLEPISVGKTACTAFSGARRVASGELPEVAAAAKAVLDAEPHASVLIFDDTTSKLIEVDFRGTPEQVRQRLLPEPSGEPASPPGPGRPRLGVVAREVTLLPKHWEWLGNQPGGASVALRKLVEQARRDNEGKDRVRQHQEATFRFMSTLAGDRPGFEEATRALYAGDEERFSALVSLWPTDVREHAQKLAAGAFELLPT